jgi:N-acetylneuraminate synthase/sialic acid synthase
MRRLTIDGVTIHDESDCYVIAEIGHNHQGSLEKAKQLFKVAKECEVNAVKLQKRDNRALYTQEMYRKPYDHEHSFGLTYGEHREALEFGWEEYCELKAYANELGITMFATAFDFPSVDFLAKLDVPAFKIASGDLKNIPLLTYVAQLQKPMIVSTGGATMSDVQRAYDAVMPINNQLCIMQCTASYPAPFEELNLQVITSYRKRFEDIVIGYSAHENGISVAVVAYMLGARVIEKHFTLNRASKGTDHSFSLEPVGLGKMVRYLRRAPRAMGDGIKRVYDSEKNPILKMGKKLVAARDLKAGHVIQSTDIAIKSPGDGLPPYELDKVIGRVILKDLREDEDIMLEVLGGINNK